MIEHTSPKRVEILSKQELARTLARLSSQILEEIPDRERLVILGIPTRGIQLAEVLANELRALCLDFQYSNLRAKIRIISMYFFNCLEIFFF